MPIAKAENLKVLEAFIGNIDGVDLAFKKDDLVDANHKAVKKWPHLFGPVVRSEAIEQATAAPGEKR